MVTDQEIAKGVETLLRTAEPDAITSLNDVVQQLQFKLGLDLSHKAGFIRDHINRLLRSTHRQALLPFPTTRRHDQHKQITPQQQQSRPPATAAPVQAQGDANGAAAAAAVAPKRAPAKTKRKGGHGGLNKMCGVTPELQAIVGEPELARTEIVRRLWSYIRKHNLQDPSNKRKIISDDALRLVFETDSTDMFGMNKLLAKHIIEIDSNQAKRSKAEVKSSVESSESVQPPVIISDALAKFFGTEEKEMLQSEALRRVWEYIKVNPLEDPLNSVVILCDEKLQELLGCESISAAGITEMLTRHHLVKQ